MRTAFRTSRGSRGLSRHTASRTLIEALESRTLLSVTFANADMAATWTYAATNLEGSVSFGVNAGVGIITGGSILNGDDVTSTPAGTFAINSDGTLSIIDRQTTKSGAMNSTKDVITVADPNGHSFTVLVAGKGTLFSNADLSGAWNLAINGQAGGTNGVGTLIFNGAGSITGGSIPDNAGTFTVTGGMYSVNTASGVLSVTIIDRDPDLVASTLTLTGALNASKDLLALNPTHFVAAANAGTNLILGIRSGSTAFTKAAVTGTWTFANETGNGWINFDGNGHITGGNVVSNHVSSGVSGTYDVDAQGHVTVNAIVGFNGMTFHGFISNSRNTIAMNTTDIGSGDNISMLVASATHANHAPNLTTVSTLQTAASGSPFAFRFADLLNASNATDADSDSLQFRITGLTTGILRVNGVTLTSANLPFTITGGDNLTWTAPIGLSASNQNAFLVQAFDGDLTSAAVPVRFTVVLPSVFSNTDATAAWAATGTGAEGTIFFDTNGNAVGELLSDQGALFTVPNSYTLATSGQFSTGNLQIGAMNSTRDVIALSDRMQHHGFSVLVKPGTAAFTNADLTGTWTLGTDGDTPGSNGLGTIIFNGSGSITGGSLKTGIGTGSITGGTYIVHVDGSIEAAITVPGDSPGSHETLNFFGGINVSKDVLALSSPDLQGAYNASNSGLAVLVRTAGTYSNADAAGSWAVASDATSGTVILDGNGHIAGGSLDIGAVHYTISGSYSFSGTTITFNVTETSGSLHKSIIYKGALNASRNTVMMNSVASASADSLTLLVRSSDRVPTLSSIAPLGLAVAGVPFAISYNDLAGAGNENDFDGNAVGFQITTISSGTLALNGTPINAAALPTTVSPGDALTWTPAANVKGGIHAFSIKAFDGVTASAAAVPVTVITATQPTITLSATDSNASEINGTASGMGMIKFVRNNGAVNQPLTVTVAIGGTATNGTDYSTISTEVHFLAGSSSALIPVMPIRDALGEGTENVTVTIVGSDTGAMYLFDNAHKSATVSIADAAATISSVATKSSASELNGTSSGAGLITLFRAGSDFSTPLTVKFTLGGTAGAGINYNVPNSTNLIFNATAGTGTVTFAAGKNSATIPIQPVNDGLANTPALNVICTVTADAGPSYLINPLRNSATVKIADAAPTVTIIASKNAATELNGQTSGFGKFTLTRTGSLAAPLTVAYSLAGSTATNGSDYGASGTSPLVTSLTFLAGSSTATITINPIDDGIMEASEKVQLTLIADGGPHYFVATKSTATVTIANHIPAPAVISGAAKNTPITLTYEQILAATGLSSDNGPITLKISAIKSGSLKKGSAPVVTNSTTLAVGESLTWTPPANATGTKQAFVLVASDSLLTIPNLILSITITS